MFIIVSYDITDDKLRNKLNQTLKDFGNSVQYSVFECNLSENQFASMKEKTDRFIQDESDSIRYYLLLQKKKLKTIVTGKDKASAEKSVYII
jgi:CRISPR-associated protein Cas2